MVQEERDVPPETEHVEEEKVSVPQRKPRYVNRPRGQTRR